MNFFNILLSFISLTSKRKNSSGDCITFTIGEDTGCQFMCDYCSENLGTNKFYFTDWICKNKNGICYGNPKPYEEYTCCTEN